MPTQRGVTFGVISHPKEGYFKRARSPFNAPGAVSVDLEVQVAVLAVSIWALVHNHCVLVALRQGVPARPGACSTERCKRRQPS